MKNVFLQGVIFQNSSSFDCGDDGICIKSGKDEEWVYPTIVENI